MAKYFLPIVIISENGVPIRGTLTLKRDGVVMHTAKYLKAGQYYFDTPIDSGTYDVYINDYLYVTDLQIPIWTPANEVRDGSITTNKLADEAVTPAKTTFAEEF